MAARDAGRVERRRDTSCDERVESESGERNVAHLADERDDGQRSGEVVPRGRVDNIVGSDRPVRHAAEPAGQ